MSYCAKGNGRITLIPLEHDMQQKMLADLLQHYKEQAHAEMKGSNSPYHQRIVQQKYEERRARLTDGTPMFWMKQAFRELGFSELDPLDAMTLDMSFNANYDEADLYSLLSVLAPYLSAGAFDFQGEDEGLWRIELRHGQWCEKSGEIVYTDQHKGMAATGEETNGHDEDAPNHFSHNGVTYTMTSDAIEAAYRYQLRQYRLMDARRQLDWFVFGTDPDSLDESDQTLALSAFEQTYGISYEDAKGMADQFLRLYEKHKDCNLAENDVWHQAITEVLSETPRRPNAEDSHAAN